MSCSRYSPTFTPGALGGCGKFGPFGSRHVGDVPGSEADQYGLVRFGLVFAGCRVLLLALQIIGARTRMSFRLFSPCVQAGSTHTDPRFSRLHSHALAQAHACRGAKGKSRIPFPKDGCKPSAQAQRGRRWLLSHARDGVHQEGLISLPGRASRAEEIAFGALRDVSRRDGEFLRP